VACAPVAAAQENVPFGEYVRLHVFAEDNSAAAQALKDSICAQIADEVCSLFEGCADGGDAWETARQNIGLIEEIAREAANAKGFSGSVTASCGMCAFETREYGAMTVPAGEYRTVRIELGSGSGRNWWCILYPEICMPEGYVPGMKVEFYSSVARWLKSLFGGNENG